MWDRLLGLFGDALLRKFGAEPPQEWETGVGYLTDLQIERGFKRFVFGWKGGPPSLPDFVRMCRSIGDDTVDEGPRPFVLPAPEPDKYDGWDITGNNRFLNYVKTRLANHPRAWGVPGSTKQAEATRIAVAYKNAWAQDMREAGTLDAATGEFAMPPREVQDRTWIDAMGRAEADIMLLQRAKAA